MSPVHFTFGTTGVLSAAQESPTATQIREQIRQSIRDVAHQARNAAAQEVRDAQQQMREAQQQVRAAQQQVRVAQQQLRSATTADQQSTANQALTDAQEGVSEAEAAVREAEGAVREAEAELNGSHVVFHTAQLPPDMQHMIPPQAVDLSIAFFVTCAVMMIGWPIARALGRRIERPPAIAAPDAITGERLQRIEQAVEAMSIEVERISESQRFMAKLRTGSAQGHAVLPERR